MFIRIRVHSAVKSKEFCNVDDENNLSTRCARVANLPGDDLWRLLHTGNDGEIIDRKVFQLLSPAHAVPLS